MTSKTKMTVPKARKLTEAKSDYKLAQPEGSAGITFQYGDVRQNINQLVEKHFPPQAAIDHRAEFEAAMVKITPWWKSEHMLARNSNGKYMHMDSHWRLWQAARGIKGDECIECGDPAERAGRCNNHG